MVSIRITTKVLLTIAIARSALAYPHDASESLAARAYSSYDELSARSYQPYPVRYVARSYSDNGLAVVARDLASLGIRSEDISHILVLRASKTGKRSSPAGLTRAECERYINQREDWLKEIEPKIEAKRKEARKTKDGAKKRRLEQELAGMKDLRDQYEIDLEDYQKALLEL